MESKKINQLATNVNPQTSDLTTIGDPITGQLKKITWLQVANLIGAQASVTLQQVTDNGNTTTDPITTAGLTLTNLGTGVPQLTNGNFAGTYGYGLANGVATLDSGGKIPASQLPSSVMEYKGTWNASTNTPTLADGTGDNGDVYLVNVAGSQNLGSGTISFAVGDWVVYNGTIWQKSLNSNAVASVFGRTGTIVAQEGDYNIDQLGDVAITTPATNDYLRYNGTGWVNTQFPAFVSSDKLVLQVRNNSGATINKGTVVYINGATAGYPTIAKAQANQDSTSAQTLGLVQDNISNNSNGIVVLVGQITGIDTSAYPAGTQLYLSGTIAGAFTSTKTLAPTHLVYVGIVTAQNAVNGVIEVKIQNGYELDEIHDVAISSVANNDGLFYESSTSLWKNKSIATVLGYTPEQPLTFSSPLSRSTNTVSIPAATGSVNGYLTSTDWTTFNNKLTSPMTTLGDIIFGGTSGNANRLAGNITTTKQYLSQTGTGTESASPTWATITGSDITGAALTKSDDTNVTLTLGGTPATALLRAASLTLGWTGQLAISRGGTGASTKAGAFDALSPMTTLGDIIYGGASGTGTRLAGNTTTTKQYLSQTGNGTASAAPSWATIAGSDITGAALTETDDTNVTLTLGGTPSTALLRAVSLTLGWTGTLAVSRGGTGASSFGSNEIIYGNSASALQSSNQFTFSPTGVFFINNTISAGGIAMNLVSTVNAAANNDIIYGVRISPTFNNGAFTGVTQRALGVFGNVYINGTITGAGWGGSVIGSNYGGAGTVSGILKANGSGVVSAAVAGTDYVTPSALNSYLPLAGGTLTGALSGTTASFSISTNAPAGISARNTNAGTAAGGTFFIGNDVVTNGGGVTLFSSGFTASGQYRTSGTYVYSNQGGGLTIHAEGANSMYLATNGTTALTFNSSQVATFTNSINGTSGSFSSTMTANRFYGVYTTVLASYATVNPSTNVLLMSSPNDRDAWIFLDQADTGSNWGIYHRNIDTQILDLPGNSIGFVGGGTNTLQAYISLVNGNAYFRGATSIGGATTISTTVAGYGLSVTNVEDSSQGLLVRSTDADTTLYLARFQSSASAVSQTWVDRFSIAKNGSTVIGDNIPAVNVRLWVKGSDQTASNYAMDVTDSLGQSIAWFRNDKAIRFYGGLTATSATFSSAITLTATSGYNIDSASDIILANAKPLRSYTTGGSGWRLISLESDNNVYIAGNGGNIIMNGGGNVCLGATSFTSDSGADRFMGIYGGQDCSLILQDAVQKWELYVNDDFYINRGSTNVLTALRSSGAVQVTGNLTANSPSEGNTGEGIIAGRSFKIDATGTGQRAVSYMVSNTLSDTYGSGLQAQYSNFSGEKAFGFNLNTAGNFELHSKNSSGSFINRISVRQDGNIGFGVANPTQRFYIVGGKTIIDSTDSGYAQFQIGHSGSGGEASICYISGVSSFGNNPTSANGDTYIWAVGANIYGIGGNNWGIGNKGAGNYVAKIASNSTSWTFSSDIRLKNIINPISNVLNKVCELNPLLYTWKSDNSNEIKIGLIAQEVHKLFPEIVDVPVSEYNDKGNINYWGLNYGDFTPILIQAIKELKQELDILKSKQ